MGLHRTGATFQPIVALKRAVVTTMAPNTQQVQKKQGSKEAKSEDINEVVVDWHLIQTFSINNIA